MRTVNRPRAGRLLLLPLLAVATLLPGPAAAKLSEPSHLFYGTATSHGQPVAAGVVSVRLAATGEELASYVLGSDSKVGSYYVLRVPIDAIDPRLPGRARPGDEVEFFLDGVPSGTGVVGERGSTQLVNVDPINGPLPSVSVADVSLYEGNAGTTAFVFTVTLSAAIGEDVTFNWGTAAGTAAGGVDYVEVPTTTNGTIAAGNTSAALTVLVNGETFQENDETFLVNLTNLSANAVLVDGQAVGTILDDDRPPAISIADVQVTEGDAGTVDAVFQLTTTRPLGVPVTASWTAADGTATTADNDYLAASGVATFAPGSTSTTVTVTVVGDDRDEQDETFVVNLSAPSPNAVLADAQGVGTIYDDDGFLTFIEAESFGPLEDLFGVSGLAVSPDGGHLYVTGRFDDAIATFSRNPVNGALTYVEVLHDNDVQVPLTLDGLDGAEAVTVSPDGKHVYVAGFNDGAVAVFSRNPATGQLTFVEVHKDASLGGTAGGLLGASALALSVDGAHLYVASFTSDAVARFTRDTNAASPTFGRLTYQGAVADNTGLVNGLDGASWLALSPTGSHLYVAGAIDKAVAVFGRNAGTGALDFVEAKIDGQGTVNGLDGVNGLAVSADGKNLYATGAAEDALAVFGRNDATGTLTFQTMLVDGVNGLDGLDGVSSVAVSHDGRFVFAGGYFDDSLDVFARDLATGNLAFLERHRNGFGGETGLARVVELAVSADDQHIYAAGHNDDAVAVFMRDALAPAGPSTLFSPSHTPGVFSNDPTVDVSWSGAADNPGGSGLAGYSVVFDATALTIPDGSVDVAQATDPHGLTGPPLPDGTGYWFHLRACDLAGNCSLTQHLGPFSIDSTAPTNPVAILSTSHAVAPALNPDRTIDMAWSVATDALSGVDGYSFFFDASAGAVCDQVKDAEETTLSATSSSLADGTWYFHLCARDNAGNWSAAATAGPYIVEAAPPQVVKVETVADTADGLLVAGERVTVPVTQIVVSFSEPVADPAGDSGPDDVTNPANFQLLRPGDDGEFQTTSCAALAGDDVLTLPSSVQYFADSRVAVARIAPPYSLPGGLYRLLVCGSTSIVDLAGNALDGNGDLTAGDDLVLPFEVAYTNLLQNPNLDAELVGWARIPASGSAVRYDAADSDEWSVSGSALMEYASGTPAYAISQCVAVTDLFHYTFGGRVRVVSPVAEDPVAFAQVQFYGSTNCTVTPLGAEILGGAVVGNTGTTWAALADSSPPTPAGARSAYVSFVTLPGTAPDFEAYFDTLFFRLSPDVVFEDDLESGGLARWSAKLP